MLSDFLRDQAFTIAWFGLMTMVWLGWAQESPGRIKSWMLGVGSGIGILFAAGFGVIVAVNWRTGSALEGKYAWFGVLVGLEVLIAGLGCWYLATKHRTRWMAFWVALVVAAHFIPLAFFLRDASIGVWGALQLVLLVLLLPRLRRSDAPTSRDVGPVMGFTLLAYAAISAVVFAVRHV